MTAQRETRPASGVRKTKRHTLAKRKAKTAKKRATRAPRKQPQTEEEDWLPRGRPGSWKRTNALLLAALRLWELRRGFRLIALPAGYLPLAVPLAAL